MDTSNQVINNLMNTYGNCEVMSNGNYHVTVKQNNGYVDLYIPSNLTQNTSVIGYVPGLGSNVSKYANASNLISMCTGDDPPKSIVSIASNSKLNANVLETAHSAAGVVGTNVSNVVCDCFSDSALYGINQANAYKQNHPEINMTVFTTDGSHEYYNNANLNSYAALRDSNTPLVVVNGINKYSGFVSKLCQNGYNAYNLTYDNHTGGWEVNAHSDANRYVINNLLRYAAGETDVVQETPWGAVLRNGNQESVSFESLRNEIMNPGEVITLESTLPSGESSQITISLSEVASMFSPLQKLAPLSLQGLSDNSKNYVKSNMVYVSDSMNKIRNTIKSNSSLFNLKNINFRSTTGVPGCLASYINGYFELSGALLDKMSQQTEAVMSYAQSIVDMDKDIASAATELAAGGTAAAATSVFTVNNANLTAQGDQPTTSNPAPTTSNPTPTASNPAPTYSGGGGGSKPTTSNPKPTVEQLYNYDREEISYVYNDGGMLVVDYKGDKISGMKIRYNIDSSKNLYTLYEELSNKYSDPSIYSCIITTDSSIEVIINNNYISSLNSSELKSIFYQNGKAQ